MHREQEGAFPLIPLSGVVTCHYRRYTMFRKILAALMLLGMLGATAGCSTMQGFGQDMERGGEKIQEKAAR